MMLLLLGRNGSSGQKLKEEAQIDLEQETMGKLRRTL